MESSYQQVYISKKCDKLFRSFTEGDNFIALYGIQNHIIGGWKTEDFLSFEKPEKALPTNIKINGFALIYNDNVYEDFDAIIQEKLEKIKSSSYNIFENSMFVFVMKDMKYTDDFEDITYEKNVMFNISNICDEIEVEVKQDFQQIHFYKNFNFLNSNIKLEFFGKENFSEDKKTDTNAISIDFDNFEKELKEIFSNEKFFVYLENEKFLINKIQELEQADVDKITNMLRKIDINTSMVRIIFYCFKLNFVSSSF